MRKKKNYRRPDPFAINPEKILAAQKKKALALGKLCAVCDERVATVHTTTCDSSGVTGWSDLCERCYERLYKSREHGGCSFCGRPGLHVAENVSPSGDRDAVFWCEDCSRTIDEFSRRPENLALLAEHHEHYKRLNQIPYVRENRRSRELVHEFLNRPENAALKAESDRLRQRMKAMSEDMVKYVRECAVRRKQP